MNDPVCLQYNKYDYLQKAKLVILKKIIRVQNFVSNLRFRSLKNSTSIQNYL